mgnify:CR=1 FL=1
MNIGGSDALGMSLEDLAIFQVIHMAKHFVYRGFGIRHLVDFVLLARKKGNDINWSSFIDRCFKYGIGKFTIAMFAACNKLFNLEVPSEVSSKGKCSDKYINAFIDDIFEVEYMVDTILLVQWLVSLHILRIKRMENQIVCL